MKRIKYPFVLILTAIIFSNYHQKSAVNHPKNDINKIVVKWVAFDMETDIRMECDQFENSFGGGYFKTSISSEKEINSMIIIIKGLKRIDNAYQPDVRGKMWLYHSNNTIDTICFSNIVLRFKNQSYETPPELIKFLVEKSNQQPKN
jgi:hypothetical protein